MLFAQLAESGSNMDLIYLSRAIRNDHFFFGAVVCTSTFTPAAMTPRSAKR
jgi:hypothetical protein